MALYSRLAMLLFKSFITASVKMIRFSYSNEDTKDEEKGERNRRGKAQIPDAVPSAKSTTTLVPRGSLPYNKSCLNENQAICAAWTLDSPASTLISPSIIEVNLFTYSSYYSFYAAQEPVADCLTWRCNTRCWPAILLCISILTYYVWVKQFCLMNVGQIF